MANSKVNIATLLKINGSFSLFNGLLLVTLTGVIAKMMNIHQPIVLQGIGVALILFAGLLFYTASQHPINKKSVQFIIIQDWLWVIGSGLLLLLQPFSISPWGNLLIGIIAMIVLVFAVFQARALR